MVERKRRRKILLLHIILLPTVMFAFYFFTLSPRQWVGVDEAVVEKIAREHGREAHKPLINTDQGDLLLFVFLLAGVVGGFAAGYYWRVLAEGKSGKTDSVDKGKKA